MKKQLLSIFMGVVLFGSIFPAFAVTKTYYIVNTSPSAMKVTYAYCNTMTKQCEGAIQGTVQAATDGVEGTLPVTSPDASPALGLSIFKASNGAANNTWDGSPNGDASTCSNVYGNYTSNSVTLSQLSTGIINCSFSGVAVK